MPIKLPHTIFHYTTPSGLEGILKDQSLRATHAEFTNDRSELQQGWEVIKQRLRPIMSADISAFMDTNPEHKHILRRYDNNLELVCDAIIDQKHRDIHDKITAMLYHGTFITCFSIHEKSSDYRQQKIYDDGLLSQWRAYGQNGGYAIEFETAGLKALNQKHLLSFDSLYEEFDEVVYAHDIENKPIKEDVESFSRLIYDCFISKEINDEKDCPPLRNAFSDVTEDQTIRQRMRCLTLIKHDAFYEEREVRIIVVPSKASKAVIEHEGLRPYIYLYPHKQENSDAKLPIRRIIVGPHPEQDKRVRALECLPVLEGVVITPSSIPLRG